MLLFSLILASIFMLFSIGSRGFRTVTKRQDTHNQLAAIRASVQTDFSVSHFYGISVNELFPRIVNGENRARDSIAVVALEDWNDSASFDDFGVPQWDHWAVYRVTQEDLGVLVRHQATPGAGQVGRDLLRPPDNLPLWTNSSQLTNPAWNDLMQPRRLAQRVRSLDVNLDQEAHAVEIEISLEGSPDKQSGHSEVVSAVFYIKPLNTVPTD